MTFNFWKFKGGKSKRCSVCTIALLSFTAGSLITARFAHIDHVRANSNRVFELRIYHAVPGKLPALESRFRDIYSKLLAKHDLQVVGYWVPEGGSRLGQHIRLPRGSFQPGRSKKELGRDAGRPGGSGGNQIRAGGQQVGGKGRPNVHAVDGLFADEVVPHLAGFDSSIEDLIRYLDELSMITALH